MKPVLFISSCLLTILSGFASQSGTFPEPAYYIAGLNMDQMEVSKRYNSPHAEFCGGIFTNGEKGNFADPMLSHQDYSLLKVPLADPFIMLHDGVYYAYGTHARDGIEVWTSTDLTHWEKARGNASGGLALHKEDVWGDRWFWAPEVYALGDRFLMYFSSDEHICAATAGSPLGPFVQEVKEPIIKDEKCIDNTLFIDDDGRRYMYFDRFNDGLNIWVAEMAEDCMTIKEGSMRKCINVSQEWEKVWPRVNEGSFVIKYEGKYYMTYSANSYESQFYGIGCAVSDSPLGPWIKYEHNPLLQNPEGLVGVGHSAMFIDTEGNMKIVFHAHHGESAIHPREMYISSVAFINVNGEYVMVIDKEYITAVTQR